MSISVLLSVYNRESPEYLHEALASIWDYQSVKPEQVVLVKDGPLGCRLESVISAWESRLGQALSVVALTRNRGLAHALNAGLDCCEFSLVARMDTDDVALPNRFELQLNFMNSRAEVAVSSGWVDECDQSLTQVVSVRRVPQHHDDIVRFAKRRNPLSHPAVIFRREAVLNVGGYPSFEKSQDYALWSLMLQQGYRMANIPRVLVRMRTGNDLMTRRSRSYLKQEYEVLRYQREIGFIGWKDYLFNVAIRSAVRLPPTPVKRLMYKLAR